MSCSKSDDKLFDGSKVANAYNLADRKVFYTFKVGSYPALSGESYSDNNVGLTLRQPFIDHLNNNFTYQGILSDSIVEQAIKDGTAHRGATLQLAIRKPKPVADLFNAQQGITYELFPEGDYLTEKEFLPQMVSLFKNPQSRLTQLGTTSLKSSQLESALHIEQGDGYNELAADSLRRSLSPSNNSTNLLSVTFSLDVTDPENASLYHVARSSDSSVSENHVWGSGFKIAFQSDDRMAWKQNVMSSMQHWDLSQFESANDSWVCPSNYRFIIVSPKSRLPQDGKPAAFPCTEVARDKLSDNNKRRIWDKVRRHLSAEDWGLNVDQRCVYPKNQNLDCYATAHFRKIQYQSGQTGEGACGIDVNNNYLNSACAEFVSFCFRN
jgi:hypothetical protein